jgi:hypothetical protein
VEDELDDDVVGTAVPEEPFAALKVGVLVVAASTLRLLLNPPPARSARMNIPSLAHWYPRARVTIGRHDRYRCGRLDRDPRSPLRWRLGAATVD